MKFDASCCSLHSLPSILLQDRKASHQSKSGSNGVENVVVGFEVSESHESVANLTWTWTRSEAQAEEEEGEEEDRHQREVPVLVGKDFPRKWQNAVRDWRCFQPRSGWQKRWQSCLW